VDQLAQDYASKPVVFLEYDVDHPPDSRYDKFWAAFHGSAGLPLIIVDSGHQVLESVVDYGTFKARVDQELPRPPQARIQATWQRTGNKVNFSVQVTNQSSDTLSYNQNKATVYALVYENVKVGVTSRYVRAVVDQDISIGLTPGSSATYTLDTPDLSGVDWNKLHFLALVDYQPVSGLAYDMLQAAVALPAVSNNPAD
jgi:hypothetical protein